MLHVVLVLLCAISIHQSRASRLPAFNGEGSRFNVIVGNTSTLPDSFGQALRKPKRAPHSRHQSPEPRESQGPVIRIETNPFSLEEIVQSDTLLRFAHEESWTKRRKLRIFGIDDRRDVDEMEFPYFLVGPLVYPDGHCTGTLVGSPYTMVTAAHCFESSDLWWRVTRFLPGYNAKDGKYSALGFAYVNEVQFDREFDFAVMHLVPLTGDVYPSSFFELKVNKKPYRKFPVVQLAYSGDHAYFYTENNFDDHDHKAYTQLKSSKCEIRRHSADSKRSKYVYHDCDSIGEASGAPLIDDQNRLIAINLATRCEMFSCEDIDNTVQEWSVKNTHLGCSAIHFSYLVEFFSNLPAPLHIGTRAPTSFPTGSSPPVVVKDVRLEGDEVEVLSPLTELYSCVLGEPECPLTDTPCGSASKVIIYTFEPDTSGEYTISTEHYLATCKNSVFWIAPSDRKPICSDGLELQRFSELSITLTAGVLVRIYVGSFRNFCVEGETAGILIRRGNSNEVGEFIPLPSEVSVGPVLVPLYTCKVGLAECPEHEFPCGSSTRSVAFTYEAPAKHEYLLSTLNRNSSCSDTTIWVTRDDGYDICIDDVGVEVRADAIIRLKPMQKIKIYVGSFQDSCAKGETVSIRINKFVVPKPKKLPFRGSVPPTLQELQECAADPFCVPIPICGGARRTVKFVYRAPSSMNYRLSTVNPESTCRKSVMWLRTRSNRFICVNAIEDGGVKATVRLKRKERVVISVGSLDDECGPGTTVSLSINFKTKSPTMAVTTVPSPEFGLFQGCWSCSLILQANQCKGRSAKLCTWNGRRCVPTARAQLSSDMRSKCLSSGSRKACSRPSRICTWSSGTCEEKFKDCST